MIEVQPKLSFEIQCKACGSKTVDIKQILFQGIHTLADCHCNNCGFTFYQTLPSGHDMLFPIQFSKDGSKSFYLPRAEVWLAKPLIDSLIKFPKQKAEINCLVNIPFKNIILINCLDSCFGHVFTKLWNAQTLMRTQPNLGVVVLVPTPCAWLVPKGVAEIWTVNLPLKKCKYWIDGLDDFVKTQFIRFEKVFLSNTFTHLDHGRHVDLEAFVKRSGFDLSKFESKPICITFVLREDRFWHNSVLMDFLFKVMIKSKREHLIKWVFVFRQSYLIRKTALLIRKQLPQAKVIVTGLGKTGSIGSSIVDHRVNQILPETEHQWNQIFSQSHLVIGMHGSNMLIPSYLAAGFINIVPRYKIPHMAEDTCQPYANRYLQFLGRHLDEFSSPKLVALHTVSIIRDFPYIYENTEQQPE